MRKPILIAFVLLCQLLNAQDRYDRIKIWLDDRPISELAKLGIEVDHGQFEHGAYHISDYSSREQAKISQAGFRFETLIQDVPKFYEIQNHGQSRAGSGCGNVANSGFKAPDHFHQGSMGGYLTYAQLMDELDSMRRAYPNLISARLPIDSNDQTLEGRYIYWLRLSDNPDTDESEPESLFTSLHHAREPNSMMQMVMFLWHLLENYATDPEVRYLVDETELYFIPCVNPDGFIYNETTNPNGGGLWRKNRRNNGGGSFGVDLNRNYGYQWGFDNIGSSNDPWDETYRGTSGFSEAETRNVKTFCESHQFLFTINYHTYGNLLIYPWGYSDSHTADSAAFLAYARYMTRDNGDTYGTGSETVGYTVNGDSDDWMYGEQTSKNKSFSYTPEAGESGLGFWPPASEIENICLAYLHQNMAVPRLMLHHAEWTNQGSEFSDSLELTQSFHIQRLGMDSGKIRMRFVPLSSNITSSVWEKDYALKIFKEASDSTLIQLDASIAFGDTIRYLLGLDLGLVSFYDTISIQYGASTPLFADTSNNMSNWTRSLGSQWNMSTQDFVSAPNSLADSPLGDYWSGESSYVQFSQAVHISDSAICATLDFWARWDIEADYDYSQVLISADGGSYIPQCGRYTNEGTSNQVLGEPLYDGQSDWVAEQIDLSDFAGQDIRVRFSLESDQFVEGDGIYIDDLRIVQTLPPGYIDSTSVVDTSKNDTHTTSLMPRLPVKLKLYPNPSNGDIQISGCQAAQWFGIRLFDLIGRSTLDTRVKADDQGIILLEGLSHGQYLIEVIGPDGSKYRDRFLILTD